MAQFLHSQEDRTLGAMETALGKMITIKPAPALGENQYEVTCVEAAA